MIYNPDTSMFCLNPYDRVTWGVPEEECSLYDADRLIRTLDEVDARLADYVHATGDDNPDAVRDHALKQCTSMRARRDICDAIGRYATLSQADYKQFDELLREAWDKRGGL